MSDFTTLTSSVAGDMQAVIDTALTAAEPDELDPNIIYSRVIPAGAMHDVVDLERFLGNPRRKKGTVEFFTADSLSRYVKAHGDDRTAIYADVERPIVVAVLDGHHDEAGWGEHRAVLRLRPTAEWSRWMARNAKIGSQTEFAEHIEDCLADIVEPSGAEMLELAQHFQATTKVAFRSAKVLTDGQRQLLYEETIDARAGMKGQLTIPSTFSIAVAPFEGAPTYKVTARLRYRMREGTLNIGYVLDRPDKVQRSVVDDVLVEIEDTTGRQPFLGIAP